MIQMRSPTIRCGSCGTELGPYARDHVCPVAEWGVWCIEDRAWCQGTIGSREHAAAELPRWVSGEAAEVDPAHFHYELRRVTR